MVLSTWSRRDASFSSFPAKFRNCSTSIIISRKYNSPILLDKYYIWRARAKCHVSFTFEHHCRAMFDLDFGGLRAGINPSLEIQETRGTTTE